MYGGRGRLWKGKAGGRLGRALFSPLNPITNCSESLSSGHSSAFSAHMAEGSGIAAGRLKEERKAWRRDHPPSFYARPSRKADGQTDLMKWDCGIPGKAGVRVSSTLGPLFPRSARHAAATRTHTVAVHTPVSLERTGSGALRLRFQGTLPPRAPPSQTRAARATPRAIRVPSPPHRGYRGFTSSAALIRPRHAVHVFVARC